MGFNSAFKGLMYFKYNAYYLRCHNKKLKKNYFCWVRDFPDVKLLLA